MVQPVVLAVNGQDRAALLPAMANRHGLITGATGTGKTVTLQVLAEAFSAMGTPVFLADVKGDLTGLAQAGQPHPKMLARLAELGLATPDWSAFPVTRWDVFGSAGHALRARIQDMGPLLLSRMLSLNDTQAGVLAVVFKVALDEGRDLVDMQDLRDQLADVARRASDLQVRYGNVSSASVGAIQRALLTMESQGAEKFFGEPALAFGDLMRQAEDGQGRISVLAADRLMGSPRLYAAFLMWLLTVLYERLPEAGDLAQPKLVFFFDEAHLLFNDAPAALLEKVEQIVRLVRSKGVGVWFVTQNPADVPDTVLGQLGNRIQHALRAYTPRDEQAVKVAARSMRPNEGLDIQAAIGDLAVGEALVSLLDEKGRPSPTQRLWILPPRSRIGPADAAHLAALSASSPFADKYDRVIERSDVPAPAVPTQAQEERAAPARSGTPPGRSPSQSSTRSAKSPSTHPTTPGWSDAARETLFGSTGPRGGRRDGLVQTGMKTLVRTGARALIRSLTAMLKGRRR